MLPTTNAKVASSPPRVLPPRKKLFDQLLRRDLVAIAGQSHGRILMDFL